MISDKLLPDAQAEYRSNVHQFLTLGEGKKLDRFDYLRIKGTYLDVEDWFEHLDTLGQLRVVKHLSGIYDKAIVF